MKDFAYSQLPAGYELYEVLDLTGTTGENNNIAKKLAIMSALIIAVMIGWALVFAGIDISEAFEIPLPKFVFRFFAMIIGIVVYIFVHEGVHGFFIKMFSGQAPFYGKNLKAGMFYAGSHCFFGKAAYITIALAPFIVWGVILAMMLSELAVKSAENWWFLYAVQIMNFTGSVGDLYVAWRTLHMPKGILVQDDGTKMRFYASRNAAMSQSLNE